jgi:peptidoglycan/xylan/chitin deacetylase (PgdA/CDA1 family)
MKRAVKRVDASRPGAMVFAVDTHAERPHVVLTYDDGPEPGGTDAVLEALADTKATATFFVLLSRTRRYPQLLADTVAAGHEIALHGVDHQRLTLLDPSDVARRTTDARHELEDTIGRAVRWFRPPYGGQSPATWRAICDTGLTPVGWNVGCRDWVDLPNDVRLAQARAMDKGAIIMAHDGFAAGLDAADDGPAPHVDRGELSRELISVCTEKGFLCRSLEQALESGEPARRVWLDPSLLDRVKSRVGL